MNNSLINTREHYGWVSIVIHWIMAVALIAMYFLGDYMVELEYYDKWYHRAPELHKEIGVILGIAMIMRLLWNSLQSKPTPLDLTKPRINLMAKLTHYAFYALVVFLVISGYLISTAKGQGIEVFGLFELPALLPDDEDRGELAGKIHEVFGVIFMLLMLLHAGASLIHHFVFKDRTLKRMLGVRSK